MLSKIEDKTTWGSNILISQNEQKKLVNPKYRKKKNEESKFHIRIRRYCALGEILT
jgi:hypothetical protein